MWRDKPAEALAEFCARADRGDTEFPNDLVATVSGFLKTVQKKEKPASEKKAAPAKPVAAKAPVKKAPVKTAAKKTTKKTAKK